MKIAVLGAGHMGEWFIKMLSKNNEVCVYNINKLHTERFHHVRILVEYADLTRIQPELVINSVPRIRQRRDSVILSFS